MNKTIYYSKEAVKLSSTYFASTIPSRRTKNLFKDVQAYVMFIGYPRSGHSIIGALLDAHPQAVIAHELAALKYVRAGFKKERLFYLLLKNTITKASLKRQSGKYIYEVPGQWQGRFENVRVIGDKQGEGATLRIAAWPSILSKLQETIRVPVKIIHICRNPFDNITTIALHAAKNKRLNLKSAIDRYFNLCETVMSIKKNNNDLALFETQQEKFVRNPRLLLKNLCEFLALKPSDEYLEACSQIVYKTPHKSRLKIDWPNEQRRMVESRMREFPYLRQYSFDD